MKNIMNYKGYSGSIEFSKEDNVFFGRIIGISDRIIYESDNIEFLRKEFEDSVEDYFELCAEIGKKPEKSYKGALNIRIAPDLHHQLAVFSASHGKTLNAAIEEAIREYIE